jgi:hypothetical protein
MGSDRPDKASAGEGICSFLRMENMEQPPGFSTCLGLKPDLGTNAQNREVSFDFFQL